jgi:hypothetical protein
MVYETTVFVGLATYLLRVSLINNSQIFTKISAGDMLRLSAVRTGHLYRPRKYSWYSFLLEAESTSGPQCDRKDFVIEEFQSHHLEKNPRTSGL